MSSHPLRPPPLRRLAALTALALASLPAAFAQLVLDADHQSAGPVQGGIINSDRMSQAQTFTAENTGWITRIDLLVAAQRNGNFQPLAPLTVDLRTLSGGLPSNANSGGNILGTSSHAASDIPTYDNSGLLSWVSFDFAPVAVTAGESLAFAVASPASGGGYEYVVGVALAWPGIGAPAGTYAGGQAYRRWTSGDTLPWEGVSFSNGTPNTPANVDLYFRVWVDTTPPVAANAVPEPSTGGLLGAAALVGLVALRRRARR